MERTINGKSAKDIIAEIESDFPANLLDKKDGHYYFPANAYQARLNEVVGIFNYDFAVEPHKILELKEKYYVTAMGTLTIRYDDGSPALVRKAEGGAEVIILKNSGQPKELTDNIKSAATDAFKACCRKLGMAEKQLQDLKNKEKGKNSTNGNTSNGNNYQRNNYQNNGQVGNYQNGNTQKSNVTPVNPVPEEEFRVVITSAFEPLNSAKGNGFKASAKDVNTNEVVSLVFWSDAIKKVEEKMPMQEFCQAYVNKALSVLAQKSNYNSKNGPEITLTVRGFAQPAQKSA